MTPSHELAPVRFVGQRPWMVLTSVSVGAGAIYLALPTGSLLQAVFAETLFVAAGALMVWRLVRDGRLFDLPWLFLGVSVALYAVISPFWSIVPIATGRPVPYPSWIDGVYFGSYGAAAAFLLSIIRRRHRGISQARRPETIALVDAAIIATAVTSLLWPVFVPAGARPGVVIQIVGVTYVLVTAVLVGLALRLFTPDLWSSTVHLLLLVWMGALLLGDVVYAQLGVVDAFYFGHPIALVWGLSFSAVGVLALHPDLEKLPKGTAVVTFEGWRLWLPLGVALVPLTVVLVHRTPMSQVLAVLAVLLNIVRLRHLSVDLAAQQRLTRRLEDTVEQLVQSNTSLARANESLEHFASIASHDLRSPVASVRTMLETLQARADALDASTRNELLDRARRRSDELLETLDALLVLSRAEAHRPELVAVDLERVVAGVLDARTDDLDDLRVDIERALVPQVMGDRTLLHVLFQNLIDNAVKYRDPERPLRIEVGGERVGDMVEVHVADNGLGIAEEDRERVFELFERADDGVDTGSGIGLATCRRIVELHGGEIRVVPRAVGTRFVVTLPAATE